MLHYLLDYGAYLLGAALWILIKAKKLKEMGDANPNPDIVFSWNKYVSKEYINFIILLLGGIALVLFAPAMIGGATVDIKSTEGAVVASMALQTLLAPFEFLMGLAGPSALLNFFGSYEKTLLNRVGVNNKEQ